MRALMRRPVGLCLGACLAVVLGSALLHATGSIQRYDKNRGDATTSRDSEFLFTNLFLDARTFPWNFAVARTGLPQGPDNPPPPECPFRATTRDISAEELLTTVFEPSFQRFTDNPLAFIAYEKGTGTETDGGSGSNRDGITDTDSTGFDGENVQTFTEPQLATPVAAVVAISLTTRLRIECSFAGPFTRTSCRSNDPNAGAFFDFPNGLDFNGDGVLNEPFSENFASRAVDGSGHFAEGPLVFQAGTIIDQDVSYNGPCVELSNDNAPATIDIFGVAIHENGHGQGLSHQLIRTTTMFPFVSDNVFSLKTPQVDDLVSSAMLYPRAGVATFASATTNSGAPDGVNRQYEVSTFLQSEALGTIRGDVVDGLGHPVFGAHVFAVAVNVETDPARADPRVAALLSGLRNSSRPSATNMDTIEPGDSVVGDYSGTLLLGPPDNREARHGSLSPDPDRNDFVLSNLLPGTYAVAVEAVDGDPVSIASVSGTVSNVEPGCVKLPPTAPECDPVTTLSILPEFYTTDENHLDETQVGKGNKRAGGEPGTSSFELDTMPATVRLITVAPGQIIEGIRIVINSGVDGVGDEPDADSAFANDVPVTVLNAITAAPGSGAAGQAVILEGRSEDDGATIGGTPGVARTNNVDEVRHELFVLLESDLAGVLTSGIRAATTVGTPNDGRERDIFELRERAILPEGRQTIRLRALDTENDEGPQSSASRRVVVVNDRNAAIEYVGAWHDEGSANSSFAVYRRHVGQNASHRARLAFNGEAVTYVYGTSSSGGEADVLINGIAVARVSHAGPGKPNQPQFGSQITFGPLPSGRHTLELRPRNGAVYVDSFIVHGGDPELAGSAAFVPGTTQRTSGTVSALGSRIVTVTAPSNAVELGALLEWTGNADLALHLLDGTGAIVDSAAAGNGFQALDLPVAGGGTYTFLVANPGGSDVSFTLTTTPTLR